MQLRMRIREKKDERQLRQTGTQVNILSVHPLADSVVLVHMYEYMQDKR